MSGWDIEIDMDQHAQCVFSSVADFLILARQNPRQARAYIKELEKTSESLSRWLEMQREGTEAA